MSNLNPAFVFGQSDSNRVIHSRFDFGTGLVFAVLVVLMFVLSTSVSLGSALMEDGQDYPVSSSTPGPGRSPWQLASSGASTSTSTSYIGIYSGDLVGNTTPPLAGLTNVVNPSAHLQISKAGSSSRTYYRSIGASITNGSIFFSFLLNVSVNPTTADEIMAELVPSVASGNYPQNPTANDALTLHAQKGTDTSHFNLGIQSLGGAVAWTSANLSNNTDYLVVIGYNYGAGQGCQLFVNPTPGAAQPAPTMVAAKGGIAEPANIGTVLFWESSAATSGTYGYDVMRVDTNWANVTPVGTGDISNSPTPMRLLFLGNSLLGISASYSNNIPAIMLNIAQNFGDSVTYSRIANSGWYLSQFVTDSTATNDINTGNYDLVILQDQTDEPALPPSRNSGFYPASRSLNTMITNHAEKTMFYETWGYINGDTSVNCHSYDIPAQYEICDGGFGSFLSMNISLREAYATISGQLGAAVAPVGLAWANSRLGQPGLGLYVLDDGYGDRHPNSYGAYLAACVFYSSIFGRSSEGCTYYSTNNPASAATLQQVAAQLVLQDPFASDSYGYGSNHFYWAYRWQQYPNPANAPTNTILISGASAHPSPSLNVDTNVGSVSNITLAATDTQFNSAGQGRIYIHNGGSLNVVNSLIVGQSGKGYVYQYGGEMNVYGAMSLGQSIGSAGQYLLTNGALYSSKILKGNGSAQFTFNGGQLGFNQFGSLQTSFDLAQAGGAMSLSNSSGPAYVYGNYYQSNSGVLSLTIGAFTNSLVISSNAQISGALHVGWAAGFQPVNGQQFMLLSAATLSGTFSQTNLPEVNQSGLGLVLVQSSSTIIAMVTNFAAVISSAKFVGGQSISFNVNGVAGHEYAIQTSTNITGSGSWMTLLTNAVPFQFSEAISTSNNSKFFRAVLLK